MKRDAALIFFALGALLCLVVSIPATAKAMELFHGQWWGVLATAVFEVGAVGSELATLAIPQWRKRLMALTILLLLATTGANYALGADAFAKATLPATYASIKEANLGWLLSIVASALFPALLFVFLTATTARYRMLVGGEDWRGMSKRLIAAEQARAALEQDRATLEQMLATARAELSSKPAPLTVEIIRVARYELTWEQAEQFARMVLDKRAASLSSVRRYVAQLAQEETT